jgi:hypothetical protein
LKGYEKKKGLSSLMKESPSGFALWQYYNPMQLGHQNQMEAPEPKAINPGNKPIQSGGRIRHPVNPTIVPTPSPNSIFQMFALRHLRQGFILPSG